MTLIICIYGTKIGTKGHIIVKDKLYTVTQTQENVIYLAQSTLLHNLRFSAFAQTEVFGGIGVILIKHIIMELTLCWHVEDIFQVSASIYYKNMFTNKYH